MWLCSHQVRCWRLVAAPRAACDPGGLLCAVLQGYFSLVGLLRVHCIVGDYQTALQVGGLGQRSANHRDCAAITSAAPWPAMHEPLIKCVRAAWLGSMHELAGLAPDALPG